MDMKARFDYKNKCVNMEYVERVEIKCCAYQVAVAEGLIFIHSFLIIGDKYDFCPERTSEYSSTGSR